MTDQEYQDKKAEIIQKYGEPEYDMHQPQNESARLLSQLKFEKANAARGAKPPVRRDARAKSEAELSLELYIQSLPDPDINDTDLINFTDVEKRIIKETFSNLLRPHKEVATACSTTYQKVTAFIKTTPYLVLRNKAFNNVLELETLLTLRSLLQKGDTKIALELGRKYGFINKEAVDVNINKSTPIEDVDAINLLKKIGDASAKKQN